MLVTRHAQANSSKKVLEGEDSEWVAVANMGEATTIISNAEKMCRDMEDHDEEGNCAVDFSERRCK